MKNIEIYRLPLLKYPVNESPTFFLVPTGCEVETGKPFHTYNGVSVMRTYQRIKITGKEFFFNRSAEKFQLVREDSEQDLNGWKSADLFELFHFKLSVL